MVLIDTSIWIKVLADKQGNYASSLYKEIAGRDIVLTRFQQLDLSTFLFCDVMVMMRRL